MYSLYYTYLLVICNLTSGTWGEQGLLYTFLIFHYTGLYHELSGYNKQLQSASYACTYAPTARTHSPSRGPSRAASREAGAAVLVEALVALRALRVV